MQCRPFCLSSVLALAVCLPALFADSNDRRVEVDPGPTPRVVEVDADALAAALAEPVPEDSCQPAAADPRLVGVWHRFEATEEGDLLRFYFFHPDGFGLYRYGKVGLTNTHSFNYRAEGGRLALEFRKTGERHELPYRLEQDGGRTWLALDDDPREAGGARYFRAPDPSADLACLDLAGLLNMPEATGPDGQDREDRPTPALGNRLWGEEVRYATGGMGFSIYQLQRQSIDGRGVGWHHRGDYDEWTTETLTFRQRGDRLALSFPLRHDGLVTRVAVEDGADGRTLRLAEDPRDFWRPHTYRDMGPSFAAAGLPAALRDPCLAR